MKWTRDKVAKMAVMIANGCTYEEIARRLRTTVASVGYAVIAYKMTGDNRPRKATPKDTCASCVHCSDNGTWCMYFESSIDQFIDSCKHIIAIGK